MPFIILTFFAAFMLEVLGSLISIIGISSLFGTNWIILSTVIALDLGKIVTVSFLYRSWNTMNMAMRTYSIIACIVMMTITSAGAAGYLTGEFQKAMVGAEAGQQKIALLKSEGEKLQARKLQIDNGISSLPEKTTVNNRLRLMKGFAAEKATVDARLVEVERDIQALSIAQISTEAKAGPILGLAKNFNVSVETAISMVIGAIILVFDPQAIFLIIAGNSMLARRKAAQAVAPVAVVEVPAVGEVPVVEVVEVPAVEEVTPVVEPVAAVVVANIEPVVEVPVVEAPVVKAPAPRKPRAKPAAPVAKRTEAVTRDLFGFDPVAVIPAKPVRKPRAKPAAAAPELYQSMLTSIAADMDTITDAAGDEDFKASSVLK